jgi:4-hydroxythreonine-4-phosphate dehydrogenase
VTKERIIPIIEKLSDTLKLLGMASPRIGVAGLNPHAGEGGAFGDEEIREIAPAVQSAQEMGIQVSGPHPADTIFVRAMKGEFQGVVFLYHDQGNIAMKVASLGKSVLVYSGLPFPCTGPTHGTAYDIAGKGEADSTSFQLATKLACELTNEGEG